jgi:hypothetical protein
VQPVASAVASHIKTAVKKAPKAIEIANQESIVKIAASVRHCDTLLIPARVGFLSRFNSELANAGERLFERTAAFVTRTQTPRRVLISRMEPQRFNPLQWKSACFQRSQYRAMSMYGPAETFDIGSR